MNVCWQGRGILGGGGNIGQRGLALHQGEVMGWEINEDEWWGGQRDWRRDTEEGTWG